MRIAKFEMLPIDDINVIEGNRELVESHVQKMYELIAENGFADAIKVLKRRGKYYTLEGQHRIESLRLHKVKEVPCLIVDWLKDDFEEIQSYIIDDIRLPNTRRYIPPHFRCVSLRRRSSHIHIADQHAPTPGAEDTVPRVKRLVGLHEIGNDQGVL